MSVQIFQRQDLQLCKCFISDITHDLIGHLVIADIHAPLCHCSHTDNHDHSFEHCKDSCKIHLSFSDHTVNGIPGQQRNIQSGRHRNCSKSKGKSQKEPVPFQVAQYFFQCLTLLRTNLLTHGLSPPFCQTVNNRFPDKPDSFPEVPGDFRFRPPFHRQAQ